MPEANGALTPYEAALSANNAYYTLQGWSAYQAAKKSGATVKPKPTPGLENKSTISREVLGTGGASLGKAGIEMDSGVAFTGKTGANVVSGMGYIIDFTHQGDKHVIVTARGTRAEMGSADLVTDLYATPSSKFMDSGLVHRGFYLTFNSIKAHLDRRADVFGAADYIHCAGHSLGGAIMNLAAYYLKSTYAEKAVHLYTFGAPRVGTYMGFPKGLEAKLGKSNIFRVSHQLDPITMIPMFPFLHVLGSDDEPNCMTIPSPCKTPSIKNHSMDIYTTEMSRAGTWAGVRTMKHLPSFEDRMMKNAWESGDGWIKKGGKLLGGSIVWVLLKVLKGILKLIGGALVVLVGTPLDLIARLLYAGVQELGKLGKKIWEWIKAAAEVIGVKLKGAADVTGTFLRNLLERFGRVVATAAGACLDGLTQAGGAFAMAHGMAAGGMFPM